MKTLEVLLLLSVFLVLEVNQASTAFSFPSIIDDAREVMMKLSTTKPSGGGKGPSTPSNTFLEVLGKVERSILEAQASGNRQTSLRKLTRSIKFAMTKKRYLFARQTLGQALYSALAGNIPEPREKRSSEIDFGKQYLKKLNNELGKAAFEKLIGLNDSNSLIFVIDNTGSMGGEINAVKDISIAIVEKLKSKKNINYILSVFNDPKVCLTKMFDDGTQFIQEVKKVRIHNSGDRDYPEKAFTGMLSALLKEPKPGSPMFVFTDATANDLENKDFVISLAKDMKININFLITGSAAKFPPYVEAARATCGMILRLTDSKEIKKLTSTTKLSLNTFVCMSGSNSGGGSNKGKRTLSKSHVISVDDSVEKMIVSISTANPNPVVTLYDPKGRIQYKGKISLFNAILYELYNPKPGRWTLTVGTSAGKYQYLVRGTSKRNIDFDYYFVMVPKKVPIPVPISQPLSGQDANVIFTVTGVEQIQTNNLKVDLLDSKSDRVLSTLTLRKRSKAHFTVSFSPPATPFRFQLRGKTLAGNAFMRSSRKTIKPITALIRVYKAMNGLLVIPRGSYMYVIMKIFNNGPTETFEVSINDPLKYMISRRKQLVKVYSKRDRRFMMLFLASRSAKPGTAYPVAVKIKGKRSGVEAAQVLNMIVSN